MKHLTLRLLALLLTLCLLFTLLPTLAFAQEEAPAGEAEGEQDNRGRGRRTPERPSYDATENAAHKTTPHTALPSYYNSNTKGYITPIRNQGSYGTCWAHGALASCEAYMIKHGIPVGTDGGAATTSLNLSEYHLAWFGYTDAYDKLGMLAGDKTAPASNYLNLGGFGEIPSYTLMRWEGLASENTSALAYNRASINGLSSNYAYNYNVAHVEDCVWIPTSDRDGVKQAIMDYGAGTLGYYSSGGSQYENENTGAYYYPYSEGSDHDVTVVGWDDNYSKNKFVTRPAGNGAWIVKNSWGTDIGDDGYYYISYYDVPSSEDTCYFYKVGPVNNYDNNYQYDGTSNFNNYINLSANASVANVFTANGSEMLEAVAFCNWDADMAYQVDIYKGCTTGNPTSGTKVSSQTGTFEYAGYHTVELNTPVSLAKDDVFSVVFTNKSATEKVIPADLSGSVENWVSWTHSSPADASYHLSAGSSRWSNQSSSCNFRIKAYTKKIITITASSSNNAYGTVSVSGMTITATPAAGYYASGYTVLSGSAIVSQNANVFTVTATADCAIRINFAAKTPCTIEFYGAPNPVSPILTYFGDSVTMPAVSGSFCSYTFLGWTPGSAEHAATAPPYLAPCNTSYVAIGDASLFALYSAIDAATGSTYYTTNVTDYEHSWTETSRIAATCTADGTIFYRCSSCQEEKSETISAPGHNIVQDTAVAPTCTEPGKTAGSHCTRCNEMTVTQTMLDALGHNIVPDVAVAPTCTEPGKTAGSHCTRCTEATTAQTVLDALGHDIVPDAAVAPTCTQTGLTAGSHCTRCTEATTAQTVLDALGHDIVPDAAVAPTCTQTGLTAGSHCSRCDEATIVQTAVDALGHDWDEGKVTLQPTATTEGIKTYTCVRCAENKTESVPATGEWKNPFKDVKENAWYYDEVCAAGQLGLMNGMTADTFEPNSSMTRAMLVTVLWRMDGAPEPTAANKFTDLKEGSWYYKAVLWAAENGIVNGVTATTFVPDASVTREQIAAIVYRYASFKKYDTTKSSALTAFADAAQVANYAKEALSWCVVEKLIGGMEDNGSLKLDPKGNATRAQVATILVRFKETIAK